MPMPYFTALDGDGEPISGAKLYFYESGGSTPLDAYQDAIGTPHAVPAVTDAAGRITVYLAAQAYRLVVLDANDVEIADIDPFNAVPLTSVDVDITGTAGETMTTPQAVYLSDGSGGKTVGRWYKADADNDYESILAGAVGFLVANADAGEAITIRLGGRMTGFVGLTPGAQYYVSAAAGSVTSTAPALARFVGVAESSTVMVVFPNPLLPLPEDAEQIIANGVFD